ncbi:MAG: hypothetical protein ACRDFB_10420 [Rhabdochlamydiaceae bacterium]
MPREEDKNAFMSCVEVALMRKGNVQYNQVIAKLHASYEMTIIDCYGNPEPLVAVLKGVYRQDYDSGVNAIELELERVVDMEKEIAKFLKILRS